MPPTKVYPKSARFSDDPEFTTVRATSSEREEVSNFTVDALLSAGPGGGISKIDLIPPAPHSGGSGDEK